MLEGNVNLPLLRLPQMNTISSVIAFSLLLMVALSRDARDDILDVHLDVRQNVTPPASNMLYMVCLNLKTTCLLLCSQFSFTPIVTESYSLLHSGGIATWNTLPVSGQNAANLSILITVNSRSTRVLVKILQCQVGVTEMLLKCY